MEENTALSPSRTSSEVGAMADVLEDFAWRFDEALAPAHFRIRPYILKSNFERVIARLAAEAEERNTSYSTLKNKRAQLKATLLGYDDDEYLTRTEYEEKMRAEERLKKIEDEMAPYEGQSLTSNEVVADEFFLKVIAEWDLTDKGVPVPLTREGVLSLNPIVFDKLREDLANFLSPARRKKKRV